MRDRLFGGVGIEPYLVNAQPYEYDEKLGSARPKPSSDRFPVRFRNRVSPMPELKQFVLLLETAVKARDTKSILSPVAADFTYARDFGGMVTAAMSGPEKFLQAYMLDSSKLAAAYKDVGWDALLADLQASKFQVIDRQICGPAEPETPEDMPDDYYFFGGYIDGTGVRIRASAIIESGIIQTLSYEALLSDGVVKDATGRRWIKLILRNGEVGYVAATYFGLFLQPKICFRKAGEKWRISGYIGGGD